MEVTKLRWVQDEMFRNWNYVKEIGVDIASLILSQLLDELVANLNHF
ncbi:hypothetical protein CASFOL_039570 [Castilleja foliolosa]|uniref:Uncharacterized protein n=1 Tax=Castilleja foliolosa TaxID=1961234 RepID=A0ABD3BHC0_9LAMI